MTWLKIILTELYSLFIDDWRFAIAILLWLGLSWLLSPQFAAKPLAQAIVFFIGLDAILIFSTLRYARAK